jgi:hypothetical protein
VAAARLVQVDLAVAGAQRQEAGGIGHDDGGVPRIRD